MALDCPKDVAAVFPMCKEATIQQTAAVEGVTMVSMQTKQSVEAAYEAYKAAAQKGGWKIIMETKQDDGTMFVGETSDKQMVVNLTRQEGSTQIQLTLGKKG